MEMVYEGMIWSLVWYFFGYIFCLGLNDYIR